MPHIAVDSHTMRRMPIKLIGKVRHRSWGKLILDKTTYEIFTLVVGGDDREEAFLVGRHNGDSITLIDETTVEDLSLEIVLFLRDCYGLMPAMEMETEEYDTIIVVPQYIVDYESVPYFIVLTARDHQKDEGVRVQYLFAKMGEEDKLLEVTDPVITDAVWVLYNADLAELIAQDAAGKPAVTSDKSLA